MQPGPTQALLPGHRGVSGAEAVARFAAPSVAPGARAERARVVESEKRKGKVQATLYTQKGDALFDLEVAYSIMRTDVFERLFQAQRRPTPAFRGASPYATTPDVMQTHQSMEEFRGTLGILDPAQCAGHFENSPALPIAILSGSLGRLAAMHLRWLRAPRGLRYAVKWTKVSAQELVFAGERVDLRSRLLHEDGREVILRATGTNRAGAPVGEIEVNYEIVSEGADGSDGQCDAGPVNQPG